MADSALEAKEQLVSLCAAWFANSNREAIKCRALHALGSIFVREPKLMLNKAFIDIMKKNLAADAAIMPQLQVLKNLQEHFVQEEADLVARTLAQSQQCESNLNSELVSDASASLIQHMHFLILESSLSPSPRIREQAVKLVKIIIHRGLTASHLWYCFFLSRSIRMSQSLCIYKILKKHARAYTHKHTQHSIFGCAAVQGRLNCKRCDATDRSIPPTGDFAFHPWCVVGWSGEGFPNLLVCKGLANRGLCWCFPSDCL